MQTPDDCEPVQTGGGPDSVAETGGLVFVADRWFSCGCDGGGWGTMSGEEGE